MYITIRSRKMAVGSIKELMTTLESGLLPLIKNCPGYIGYYLIDSGDSVVSAISLFDDQSTAEDSNEVAENWVRDNLNRLVPNPATIISGQVIVPKELN